MTFEVQRNTFEARIQKRFIEFWRDEMGPRGEYKDEYAIYQGETFVCWASTLEKFLSSPVAVFFDTETVKKIVALCKSGN